MDEKIQVFERKRFFSGNRIKFSNSIHTTINQFRTSSYNITIDLVITLRIIRSSSVKQFEITDNFWTRTRMKIGRSYFGKIDAIKPLDGRGPESDSIEPCVLKKIILNIVCMSSEKYTQYCHLVDNSNVFAIESNWDWRLVSVRVEVKNSELMSSLMS